MSASGPAKILAPQEYEEKKIYQEAFHTMHRFYVNYIHIYSTCTDTSAVGRKSLT